MEQRVLVCGGRDFHDLDLVFMVLDTAHAANPIIDLIHGAAQGADMLAHEWAYQRNVRMHPYRADWKTHGKAAGPLRNQRMLDEGKPHLVIAFPGNKGTSDMVRRAMAAKIPVVQVKVRDEAFEQGKTVGRMIGWDAAKRDTSKMLGLANEQNARPTTGEQP